MLRRSHWASGVGLVLFVTLWWATAAGLRINPIILPTPRDVVVAFVQNWSALALNVGVTMAEAVLGFILGGVAAYAVAIAFVRWRLVHDSLYPYAIALKSTPLIALAPLLTMWLGEGI